LPHTFKGQDIAYLCGKCH